MISLTGFPNAANGFAAGGAGGASFFSASGVTTSVGLTTGVEAGAPKEKEGTGATFGASSCLSLTIEAKKLGFSPSATFGAGGVEVEVAGVAKENAADDGFGAKRSVAGAAGLAGAGAAGLEVDTPNEIGGRGGMVEAEDEGAEGAKENAGLSVKGLTAGAADKRLNKLEPSPFPSPPARGDFCLSSDFLSAAGAAPNENPVGNFIAGIWIFDSASSSIGGRSSSRAENTLEEAVC